MSQHATEDIETSPESSVTVNEECCFSDEPCTLGSPIRKVISHFFGRNKTATSVIPEEMVPKLCRKHYQRARYRGDKFGLLQWKLINLLLERVRLAGEIQTFKVQLRKRSKTDDTVGGDAGFSNANAQGGMQQLSDPRNTVLYSKVPDDLVTILSAKQDFTLDELEWVMSGIHAVLDEAKQRRETRYFPDIEILPVPPPGFASKRVSKKARVSSSPDDSDFEPAPAKSSRKSSKPLKRLQSSNRTAPKASTGETANPRRSSRLTKKA